MHGATSHNLEMLARVKKLLISSLESTFDVELSLGIIPGTSSISQALVDVEGIMKTHESLKLLVFFKVASPYGLFCNLLACNIIGFLLK